MKKFTVVFFSLFIAGASGWACQSGEDRVKKAENDVFAIHDEVMPRIDDVMKLRKQLNLRLASADSAALSGSVAGTLRGDEEKEQARLLSRNLANADSLMMGWMSHYNGDTLAKLSADDALRYLTEQKDKITDVKIKLNNSVDEARQFLEKK